MATLPSSETFVRWFRQVAPYLHAFGGRTFVLGFGGEMVAERARFAHFVHDLNLLAALDIRLVLVHGARLQIDHELKAMGHRSRYAKGLRITDEKALTAVKHAAGVLRLEIEAILSQGLPNSPMAGAALRVASGNFITAQPLGVLDGTDYQYTGTVRKIDAAAINRRLETGEVVLIPHVGYSPTGEIFNLQWEDVAEAVAVALKAHKLLMYVEDLPTDKRGAPVSQITREEAERLASKGTLKPLTQRPFSAATRAVVGGVGRAHLISRNTLGGTLLELFTHGGVGTMITPKSVDKLRPAKIEDVQSIISLIEPLEAAGTLVKRNREALEREIGNFFVVEHDGMIRGCAAIYPYPEAKSAELACLAVAPEFRDTGAGEELLLAVEERAKALRIRKLFALTTRAAHWFLEQGFKPATVSALPEQRRELYNWKRGSKVFLKRI